MDFSGNILDALNDDCLYEIFTRKCIDINDLMEVASTCQRCQWIAKRVFRTRFKHANHFAPMINWPLDKFENYLQLFGEFCEVLDIHVLKCDQNKLLRLITKYCKNVTDIRCCGKIDFSEFKQFFSKLINLEYSKGTFNGDHLFEDDASIKSLKFCSATVNFPLKKLPNLQHVFLYAVRSTASTTFFQLNNQITTLYLNNFIVKSHLNESLKHLVNLTEFTYWYDRYNNITNYSCFENMSNLRKLDFILDKDRAYNVLSSLHRGNAPLESLVVGNFCAHKQTIDLICQYKSIERLVTHCACAFKDVLEVIDNMPQLKHICCDMFDVENALEILQHSTALQSALFKVTRLDSVSAIETISQSARANNICVKITSTQSVCVKNWWLLLKTPNICLHIEIIQNSLYFQNANFGEWTHKNFAIRTLSYEQFHER